MQRICARVEQISVPERDFWKMLSPQPAASMQPATRITDRGMHTARGHASALSLTLWSAAYTCTVASP